MKSKIKFLAAVALALTTAAGQAQTFTTIKSFGNITNVTGFEPVSTLVPGPDGTLYGTTLHGGGSVEGTVFKMQPDGSGFVVLKWFTNSVEGANPCPGLVLSGATLYGTTANGGASNFGTVFKINTDGTGYAVLKSFSGGDDGANPYYAALTLSGSVLYGATYYGGTSNSGTLFKLNTDGTGFTTLHRFPPLVYYTNSPVFYYANSDGANPDMALTVSGSVIYGTTENGGPASYGTLFTMNTDGTGYTVLHTFTNNPDGAYPDGVLTLSDGVLYGTTFNGGSIVMGSYYNAGTLFRINTDGTGYAILKSFNITDGENPSGSLVLSGNVLYGTTSRENVFHINTDGTGYTVLKDFTDPTDGSAPYGGLTLSGGVLYGTTSLGGQSLSAPRVPHLFYTGTAFKLNTDGTGFTVLKKFVNGFAVGPEAGLTVSGGVLYGTTAGRDANDAGANAGTVFKVNTDGTGYTVLKSFVDSDGASPNSDLTLSEGVLYGTTVDGGISDNGTVFKVNTDGTGFSVLKNFAGSDGANPYCSLALSGSVLYGTTWAGGISNNGTLFEVNNDGTGYMVVRNFTGSPDGAYPAASLTLSAGVLYGTTYLGGNSHNYPIVADGTVFKVNTDGTGYTVLHNFTNSPDGSRPGAALMLSGGVLYGTTFNGGSLRYGTVFRLNIDGTGYAVLKSFTGSDGKGPLGGLALVGSVLYGTTYLGGGSDCGTLFRLNTDGNGYTLVKNFTGPDGAGPVALTLSGAVLYGTTSGGGAWGDGSVFSLSFAPQLTITPAGANVVVSWPTNVSGFDYSGYILQSTTQLGASAVWATNSPTPVVINGQNTVTNPISGLQKFYRLIQ
jgi:uncharacterized repeat protein (TIGR03803 family)